MKKNIRTLINFLLIAGVIMIFATSCKKDPAVQLPAAQLPVVTTSYVTYVSSSTAVCGGIVISVVGGNITTRGVCWSTSVNPTIADSKTADGTGAGSFRSSVTGLTLTTTYYVRAYATNSIGITGYGNEVSFRTNGTVTDIDGNVYNTVTIGTQVWMVENLKTTKYRDRSPIANVTDNTAWGKLTSGAQCCNNNDAAIGNRYGRLYNWYAVADNRNIAPIGWHVASDAEWTTLENYVGTNGSVGKALASTTDWDSSDFEGAIGNDLTKNNTTGFTALPGGYRSIYGLYGGIGEVCAFWSSTEVSTNYAWLRHLDNDNRGMFRFNEFEKSSGYSVRCIKN